MTLTDAQRRHVQRFVQRALATNGHFVALPEDLAALVFHETTLQEEISESWRDFRGNWDWQFAEAQRRGELYVPRVDEALRRWVDDGGLPASGSRCLPRWPGGKPFALCLTHDVDFVSRYAVTFRHWREVLGRVQRVGTGKGPIMRELLRLSAKLMLRPWLVRPRSRDEFWTFEEWMALEESHGFRSTFYFFAERLPLPHRWDTGYSHRDRIGFRNRRISVKQMMREISQGGWEVGLHGSYNSATHGQALREEKRQIEGALDAEVSSIRQHYLHYDAAVTPVLQAKAGFRADSTQGFTQASV